MKNTVWIGSAAIALSACVNLNPYTQTVRIEAGPQPTAAQLEPLIKQRLAPALKDPDSLKQFRVINIMRTRYFLGAPISNPGAGEGWLACFEYNARNSYGAYTGLHVDGFVYRLEGDEPQFVMTQGGAIMAPRCTPY
jgi:hypothetical protein